MNPNYWLVPLDRYPNLSLDSQSYIEQNIPWYQGQQVFESAYHNPLFFPEDEKIY